jgi:hypothetical protein
LHNNKIFAAARRTFVRAAYGLALLPMLCAMLWSAAFTGTTARAQSGAQTINGTMVYTEVDRSRGVATFSNNCGSQTLTQRELQAGAIPSDIIPCPRPSSSSQRDSGRMPDDEACRYYKEVYDAVYLSKDPFWTAHMNGAVDSVRHTCTRAGMDDVLRDLDRREAQRTGKPMPTPAVAVSPEQASRNQECQKMVAYLTPFGDSMGQNWLADQLAKGRCNADGTASGPRPETDMKNIGVDQSGAKTCPVGQHLFAPYGRPAVCQPNAPGRPGG